MVCIHCLSLFGFILAILYEILKKTCGLSIANFFYRGKPKEGTEDQDQTKEAAFSCPYKPNKMAEGKTKAG